MKNQEIRELSAAELVEKLREEKTMYQKMKFNHAVSPVENSHKIRASRKEIARYLTELNRRKNESTNQA